MADKNFNARFKQKHDTEANWAKATFAPLAGEFIVYDADENNSTPRIKIGDGETQINDLPFTDEGKMSYLGEVNVLPTTANEGEMYTVSLWNKLGSYTNNNGMTLFSDMISFSTWDSLSYDLYDHIQTNYNGQYRFIIDGQAYTYVDVGINSAGESGFVTTGVSSDVTTNITIASGASVKVYWLSEGIEGEIITYVYHQGEFVKTSQYGEKSLSVAKGGTGKSSFQQGYALIGNGKEPFVERYITNNQSTSSDISSNNNLITSNTLRYAINRTTSVAAADTNYSTYMARGTSLNSSETTPTINGTIAWTYE